MLKVLEREDEDPLDEGSLDPSVAKAEDDGPTFLPLKELNSTVEDVILDNGCPDE